MQHFRHRLAAHVAACRTTDYVVLLDCRTNRYLGASASEAAALAPHIEGWPWPPLADGDLTQNAEAAELLAHLLELGMLTHAESGGASTNRPLPAPPTRELIEGYGEVPTEIQPGDLVRFLLSALAARTLLRWRSFDELEQRAQLRRTRAHERRSRSLPEFEPGQARALVTKFERLERLFFTRVDMCLVRSVTLTEFLARHGLFPYCVLGVATNPFRAHCWVQEGDVVLNDSQMRVYSFTPILAL